MPKYDTPSGKRDKKGKVIKRGCVGQPKGMLVIAWELSTRFPSQSLASADRAVQSQFLLHNFLKAHLSCFHRSFLRASTFALHAETLKIA